MTAKRLKRRGDAPASRVAGTTRIGGTAHEHRTLGTLGTLAPGPQDQETEPRRVPQRRRRRPRKGRRPVVHDRQPQHVQCLVDDGRRSAYAQRHRRRAPVVSFTATTGNTFRVQAAVTAPGQPYAPSRTTPGSPMPPRIGRARSRKTPRRRGKAATALRSVPRHYRESRATPPHPVGRSRFCYRHRESGDEGGTSRRPSRPSTAHPASSKVVLAPAPVILEKFVFN